ncbi:MAG: sodium:solute symporter family protein [candidate division KSB1 bacterium]|jgi:SSS family solute:Na+ symporter|nr:sodium:solute symporter family protein [candidate division KSB1 bacterium]
MNFTPLDWLFVALFFFLTIFVTLWTRKRISNYDSYLLAGRSLKLYLAMASLGATEIGLVSLMYFAQQGYVSGFSAFIIGIIGLFGFLFVGKTGFIIKGLRRLRCRTVSEFFGMRFNLTTQVIAGTITFLAGMMNMGVFLILAAKFILHVVGIPADLLPYLMIGLLVFVLIYTIIGGMVSVVITDYIQFIILFTGMLITTYFALKNVGYGNVIQAVQQQYGDGGFNPFISKDLGWSFIIWMLIGSIFGAMWPPAISRALSTTDSETSRKTYLYISFSFLGRVLLPMIWGICALAYFRMNPSLPFPMDGSAPDTASAMPVLLSQILPAGIIGLMTAAALAGMMSTFDSYLLCWSSIFVNDIILPVRKNQLSEQSKIFLTRIMIIVCGLFVLIWGYFYKPPETVFRFLAITGTMYVASILLTIAMGLYWKHANAYGALASLLIGGLFPLTAIFIKDASILPENLHWLTSDKIVGIATYGLALAGIVVISLTTQRICPPKKVVLSQEQEMEKTG